MNRAAGAVSSRPRAAVQSLELSTGWEVAFAPAGRLDGPGELDGLAWLPAAVPGTAAGALRAAGQWEPGDPRDFDRDDWWFRVRFDAPPALEGERLVLALDGIATVAKVYLNGEYLLDVGSMFEAHEVDVTARVREGNELVIHCAALTPLLGVSRRPRARWPTRLVRERNLRFFRTMLLGRAPGFAPGPAAVGPWKPVRLELRRGPELRELRLRSALAGERGVVSVSARLEHSDVINGVALELTGPTGLHRGSLELAPIGGGHRVSGELAVGGAAPWWPHTHGAPALYEARLVVELAAEPLSFQAGRMGFRSLRALGELEQDGLRLSVNDVPVFARGAVWTPPDIVTAASSEAELRPILTSLRDAGMNMLRVPGTGGYAADAFHDLCDELGILVWQDFMFANLDYPEADPAFRAAVEREVRQLLERIGGRPSLAVLCGGSEVAQQAAMMGLDAAVTGGPLYDELLPALISEAELSVPYVPSTPWGGDLPFRPDRGVANYYGVGAYLRPIEDARRSEVRFAAECLAFANVPDDEALEALAIPGGPVVHHPRWKAGVPRDVGAGWDFEDVRDHYLQRLFGVDPVVLRYSDHERYLELSREVTGEIMAEVMGEWRRADSACAGALVLWTKDLYPGAGWGLLDHRGEPKVAYHHLRRALAAVAVWSTDEGLGGVLAHVANDRPEALEATLRVALYRDREVPVEQAAREIRVAAHGAYAENVEALIGRFVDASWAYRFGPPAHDLIVLSLEPVEAPGRLLSQSFRFPAGRPLTRETAEQIGPSATMRVLGDGTAWVTVSTQRLLYGARLHVPGFRAVDDAFSVEPGHSRELRLVPGGRGNAAAGRLTALNLSGHVPIASR